MKKITYLCAVAAVCAACSGNKGYTIKGTAENASDGDVVYLQSREGRNLVKLDSATIQNGTFTLKGMSQDSLPVFRYLTCKENSEQGLVTDFFLENGNISVTMGKIHDVVTGTPANDVYQGIRELLNTLKQEKQDITVSLSDTTLTDEQRAARKEKAEAVQEQILEVTKAGISQNITNVVGVQLLKQNYYYMDVDELDAWTSQIPDAYAQDEAIAKIKENVVKLKATSVGQKFTDFEMQAPDGKAVRLSDYVGKGKVVLVDFWASWCGPCRREMPNLVEAYAKYKNKKFEIVGVSLDQNAEAWKNAIGQLGMKWPQMSDLKYWDCEGAKLYAVSSIPHTVLIDGEGNILARGLHGEGLQEKLAEVLK